MNRGFIPNKYNKEIHEQISNNFRENQFSATKLPTFALMPPRNSFQNELNATSLYHPFNDASGINNIIDFMIGHVPTNLMGTFPNDFMSLMNNITGMVEQSSHEHQYWLQ